MAAAHEGFGPQTHHEKSARDLHRDTRPWFQRLSGRRDGLTEPQFATFHEVSYLEIAM